MRAEILELIGRRPSSPKDLSKETGEPLATMTYHSSVLYEAGCVRARDPLCNDPAERVYEIASLESPPPRLELSGPTKRRALSSVLLRIAEKGRAALFAATLDERSARLSCETVLLDEQGLREARTILDEAATRIAGTRSASAKRLSMNRGGRRIETTIALAAFESPPEK